MTTICSMKAMQKHVYVFIEAIPIGGCFASVWLKFCCHGNKMKTIKSSKKHCQVVYETIMQNVSFLYHNCWFVFYRNQVTVLLFLLDCWQHYLVCYYCCCFLLQGIIVYLCVYEHKYFCTEIKIIYCARIVVVTSVQHYRCCYILCSVDLSSFLSTLRPLPGFLLLWAIIYHCCSTCITRPCCLAAVPPPPHHPDPRGPAAPLGLRSRPQSRPAANASLEPPPHQCAWPVSPGADTPAGAPE